VPRLARALLGHLPRYSLLGVLVALYGLFWALRPEQFGSWANVQIITATHAVTLLLALAVIIPLRGGDFDLSVGASMGLAAAVAGVLMRDGVTGVPAAIVLGLLAATAVGVVNGTLVLGVGLPPFVVTLGTLIGVEGVSLWVTGGQIIPSLPVEFTDALAQRLWGLPLAVYYGWALALVLWYVFDQTPFGRHLLFLGSNRSAAVRTGIRAGRIRFVAFVLCSLIAGFAGLVFAALVGSVDPVATSSYLLPPYAAAFLGTAAVAVGRFNVLGTVIAIYVLAVGISGFQTLGASYWVANVFNGVALLTAITVARVFHGKALETPGA
jgi:ribose transport system permease protein